MRMDYKALTVAILKKTSETQGQLASRLGVSQPSVSRWVNGGQPELDHAALIVTEARRLKIVNPKTSRIVTTAQIVGYVGAGGSIQFHDGQGPFGEADMPPNATDPGIVAVIVKGASMSPLLEDGWTIYYDNRRDPPDETLHGKLCVVGLADERVLVKKLYPGRKDGHYNLHSISAEAILDVPVSWAAKVTWIAPK